MHKNQNLTPIRIADVASAFADKALFIADSKSPFFLASIHFKLECHAKAPISRQQNMDKKL